MAGWHHIKGCPGIELFVAVCTGLDPQPEVLPRNFPADVQVDVALIVHHRNNQQRKGCVVNPFMALLVLLLLQWLWSVHTCCFRFG